MTAIQKQKRTKLLKDLQGILDETEPQNKKAREMGWELCVKPLGKSARINN